MNMKPMMSSRSSTWETPHDLFAVLDGEFHFDLDVCATAETAKCERFYSPDDDGLSLPWPGVCWMNPPYGRQIGKWMHKAEAEAGRGNTIVCLPPARVDTQWWWMTCKDAEVRFLPGRLKFLTDGEETNSAPFPSAVVVMRRHQRPSTTYWDWRECL